MFLILMSAIYLMSYESSGVVSASRVVIVLFASVFDSSV